MWKETKDWGGLLLWNGLIIIGAYIVNWLWNFGVDYVITDVLGQKNEIIAGLLNMVFNYFCGGILDLVNLCVTGFTLWTIVRFTYYYLSYHAVNISELIGKILGGMGGVGLLVLVFLGVVISYIKLPVLFENAITMLVMMIAIDVLLGLIFLVTPLVAGSLLFSANRFVIRRNHFFYIVLPMILGIDIYIGQFLYHWFSQGFTINRTMELIGVWWDYYKSHCIIWCNYINTFFHGNKNFDGLFT
jgi:hypothetical protein